MQNPRNRITREPLQDKLLGKRTLNWALQSYFRPPRGLVNTLVVSISKTRTQLGSGWEQVKVREYFINFINPAQEDSREDGHEGPGQALSGSVIGAFRLGQNTVLASSEPGEARHTLSPRKDCRPGGDDALSKHVPAPHLHPPTHIHLDPLPSHTGVLTALLGQAGEPSS